MPGNLTLWITSAGCFRLRHSSSAQGSTARELVGVRRYRAITP